MNKLREKFENWLNTNPRKEITAIQCEQITDDFSISFAEWLNQNRWFTFENGKWCYSFENGTAISKTNYDKNYRKTTTELQQYFKENVYNK
jgi:hypothetical protein